MRRHAIAACLTAITGIVVPCHAMAEPEAEPGTEGLCRGYEETVEGYWLNRDAQPVLRFRYASNRDGEGCYAWLNRVDEWGINGVGTLHMDLVQWNGDARSFEQGKAGISIDHDTGKARFVNQQGRATPGYILK